MSPHSPKHAVSVGDQRVEDSKGADADEQLDPRVEVVTRPAPGNRPKVPFRSLTQIARMQVCDLPGLLDQLHGTRVRSHSWRMLGRPFLRLAWIIGAQA